MSRDILVATTGRDIQWLETRDAVQCPTMTGQTQRQRITQTQDVNSALTWNSLALASLGPGKLCPFLKL